MFNWVIAGFVLQFISSVITVVAFTVIKFNDLRHLEKYVNELKSEVKEMGDKLDTIISIQSAQQAICNERHK